MEYLPNEILELICTDPIPFVNAYTRYAVSRTCRALYAALGSASVYDWHPEEKAAAQCILTEERIKASGQLTRSLVRLGCFDWLVSAHRSGFAFDAIAPVNAAKGGHLNCLEFCHQKMCHVNWSVVQLEATKNGKLDCLKYASDYVYTYCMSRELAALAARYGNLDCLVFLADTFYRHYFYDYGVCIDAAKYGHIECLKYAVKRDFVWQPDHIIGVAASNGHLDCVVYAHQKGAKCDHRTLLEAASNGHTDCLQYIHQHGGRCTNQAALQAASRGHLDCLRYITQNGIQCTHDIAAAASYEGHLDCLIYTLQYGANCSYAMAVKTASNGHIDCLRYLLDNYPEIVRKEDRAFFGRYFMTTSKVTM